jgi:hypothetical protein
MKAEIAKINHALKSRTSFFVFAMVVAIFLVTKLKGQSNALTSLILPPTNWDVQKHILAPLLATNMPGNYPLSPPWVGVEKVTARIGWYANEFERRSQTNQWFHFDRLTVSSGPILPRAREDRFICESKGNSQVSGSVYGYRHSLPTDSELLAIHDDLSVSNFIGWNPFCSAMTNTVAIGSSYFTLGPHNSIETLSVMFMKDAGSSNIESIIVRRGNFHSQ